MVAAFPFLYFIFLCVSKGRKGGRSVLPQRGCHVPATLCQSPWQVTTLFAWTRTIMKRTKQRLEETVACWKSCDWDMPETEPETWVSNAYPIPHSLPVIKCPSFSSTPHIHTHLVFEVIGGFVWGRIIIGLQNLNILAMAFNPLNSLLLPSSLFHKWVNLSSEYKQFCQMLISSRFKIKMEVCIWQQC